MQKLSLNGSWRLSILGSPFPTVDATVPGSVYHDLYTAGQIPDPFYRDNEIEALKIMEYDFSYSRSFTADPALPECDQVLLHCDGLDTLADIFLNGQAVGSADNMHRTWEFDVKSVLHPGENEIRILFHSPTRFIREAYKENPADGTTDAMEGFPSIRKAHCMFGWDWGPRLPDAGIWRDISIIGVQTARIRDVRVDQQHSGAHVTLTVHTHVTQAAPGDTAVQVTVTAPDGREYTACGADCVIEIEEPQLWWPAGFGEQPLYTVSVQLSDAAILPCTGKAVLQRIDLAGTGRQRIFSVVTVGRQGHISVHGENFHGGAFFSAGGQRKQ